MVEKFPLKPPSQDPSELHWMCIAALRELVVSEGNKDIVIEILNAIYLLRQKLEC